MLPSTSISEFLMREDDIRFPSFANIIGTIITCIGERFFSFLNWLSNLPLLCVSSLTTNASIIPSIAAGPKSLSSFEISNSEVGNFSCISNSNLDRLLEKSLIRFLLFLLANSSDV